MPHTPATYLTAALRSRLIRATVSDSNATDIICFLEELGLEPPPENDRESLCRYLLSQLAHWAQSQSTEKLIRCCEGLAQFYLLEAKAQPELLQQLNAHLPQGLSFSLISGRILWDQDLFYSPQNPFLEESPYLDKISPKHSPEQKEQSSTAIASTSGAVESVQEVPEASPSETVLDRQIERQRIVSQRMNMLKNQLLGRIGS